MEPAVITEHLGRLSSGTARGWIQGEQYGARSVDFGATHLQAADVDIAVDLGLEPLASSVSHCARIRHVLIDRQVAGGRDDLGAERALIIATRPCNRLLAGFGGTVADAATFEVGRAIRRCDVASFVRWHKRGDLQLEVAASASASSRSRSTAWNTAFSARRLGGEQIMRS